MWLHTECLYPAERVPWQQVEPEVAKDAGQDHLHLEEGISVADAHVGARDEGEVVVGWVVGQEPVWVELLRIGPVLVRSAITIAWLANKLLF